jgi:uncharacterized peroxidase-related enzyme
VRALCDFAVLLTRTPSEVRAADIQLLRSHGWDDAAIHDAIQVIAYFNYINRVADAVGIEDEPDWDEVS